MLDSIKGGRFQIFLLFFTTALFPFGSVKNVSVQNSTPPPMDRTSKIEIDQTQYQWRLLFASDQTLACSLAVDHTGSPSDEEIGAQCGQNLLADLKNTQLCQIGSNKCTGLLLESLSMIPVHKKIEVLLSPPTVWLSLSGCEQVADQPYCSGDPELVFKGEESLPNEHITRIEGSVAGTPFSCDGDECRVKLSATDSQGVPITFWGDSSFGDSTAHFTAFARVIPVSGVADAYNIDVVSSQWQGKDPPSCSDVWQVFPDSLNLPGWLDTPQNAEALNSSDSLYFLSAALIKNGLVDAGSCADNGLQDASTANQCGVEQAAPKAQYWQNSFDQEILSVARVDGIPAQLLKNMFLRESQLWPGIYRDIKEVGLGQLTENGADTTLLWNPAFFNSFCPLVLDDYNCSVGYAGMDPGTRAILRGALLKKTNASCPDCAEKIDLTKVDFSIHVFAQTLKANCNQVNQLIENTTHKSAREVSDYDDLWRFALVNYNAGPGCLGRAISRTWGTNSPIDWSHVMTNIDPACQGAVKYVVDITDGETTGIGTFSTPLPTGTIIPSATPTSTLTPTPTLTPTVTITPIPTVPQPTVTETPAPTTGSS
jgi:Predicted solute binding protein